MENTKDASGSGPAASGRSLFIVAVLASFGAGLLAGYIIGAGGAGGGTSIPDTVFAVEVGGAPQIGPVNAPVTIVEFTDFRCPYCRKGAQSMQKLIARHGDEVRVVFKNHPMERMHPDARVIHEAAMSAQAQGRFWEFHDRVFAAEGPLGRAEIESMAAAAGLDPGRLRSDLDSHSYAAAVEADLRQGESLGVTGTPTFFINGRKVVGSNDRQIEAIVNFELDRTRKLMESGVPAERIYATILDEGLRTLPVAAPPPAKTGPRTEDPEAIYRVEPENSTQIGKPDALVTIVWFVDYQCPFTAEANEKVKKLLDLLPGEIRLIIKNNPQPRHLNAQIAAEAALAAGAQGSFREMHEKLFENREALDRDDLERYAKDLKLDLKAFRRALDDHEFLPTIKQEQKTALMLGATSTPTYFINGRKLKGNQPQETLEEAVRDAKTRADLLAAKGVAPMDIYMTIIKDGASTLKFKDGSSASIPADALAPGPVADPSIPL